MTVRIADLGQCIFTRSAAQVQVRAHANVYFSDDPACTTSITPIDLAALRSTLWVSRCARLNVYIDFRFEKDLMLDTPNKTPMLEVLASVLKEAQLWTQLGLETRDVRILDAPQQMNFSPSVVQFSLNDISSPPVSSSDTLSCAPKLQPPSYVSSYKISRLDLSLVFSRMSHTYQGNEHLNSDFQMMLNRKADVDRHMNSMNEGDAPYSSPCVRNTPGSRVAPVRTRIRMRSDDPKVAVSLLNAALRNFLCAHPTTERGVQHVADYNCSRLATIAPSAFMLGYSSQMQERLHLVSPVARFLSAFLARASSRPLHPSTDTGCSITLGSNTRYTAPPDWTVVQTIEADLWTTMSNVFVERGPAQKLKPLVVTSTLGSNRIESFMIDCRDMLDIQDDDNEQLDETSLLDTEDGTLLFDIYETQLRMMEQASGAYQPPHQEGESNGSSGTRLNVYDDLLLPEIEWDDSVETSPSLLQETGTTRIPCPRGNSVLGSYTCLPSATAAGQFDTDGRSVCHERQLEDDLLFPEPCEDDGQFKPPSLFGSDRNTISLCHPPNLGQEFRDYEPGWQDTEMLPSIRKQMMEDDPLLAAESMDRQIRMVDANNRKHGRVDDEALSTDEIMIDAGVESEILEDHDFVADILTVEDDRFQHYGSGFSQYVSKPEPLWFSTQAEGEDIMYLQ